MATGNSNNAKSVILTETELQTLLEKAAQDGARLALGILGLHDEHAGQDIKDLRSLIGSYRAVKSAVWKKLVDRLITLATGAFLMWLAARFGWSFTEAIK